jgi:hypothetical protein
VPEIVGQRKLEGKGQCDASERQDTTHTMADMLLLLAGSDLTTTTANRAAHR